MFSQQTQPAVENKTIFQSISDRVYTVAFCTLAVSTSTGTREAVIGGSMHEKTVMKSRDETISEQEIVREHHTNMLNDWEDFLRKYQHDLQGPLRNIANYLQILKEELANADSIDKSATLRCISAAEYCVYTLNSINISQLLDNHNTVEAFDLETLLEPLHCLLLSQLNERNCHIDIEPGLPNIIGNKDEILRVFKNLIENSLNHAETKGALIISIRKLCQRDNRIMLQFSDNGKVLTGRVRKKIRNSFNLPASGISIVNSLLTKNHGFLQLVKSERGCMWELELPAKVELSKKATPRSNRNYEMNIISASAKKTGVKSSISACGYKQLKVSAGGVGTIGSRSKRSKL